jgi:hypothetical protein
MTRTMMPLSKRRHGQSSIGRPGKTSGHSRRKTEPVKLPKTLGKITPGASANQVPSVMILNIANIKIKNNTTIMVSDVPSRHKMHAKIRNKRYIRDMKRVRGKSALSSNTKRGSIGGMNNASVVRMM